MKNQQYIPSEKICCFIPKGDFRKAALLAAIAKEEGAGFVEVQIPLTEECLDLSFIEKTNAKILFSFDHFEIQREDLQKKIPETISNLINYSPYAIELDCDIDDSYRNVCIQMINKSKSKLICAKYFQKEPTSKEIKQTIIQMANDLAKIYKICIAIKSQSSGIESLKIVNYLSDKEFILNLAGEEQKLFQVITPFLGAKFTYGFISSPTAVAMIGINYLKKSLESLYENFQ